MAAGPMKPMPISSLRSSLDRPSPSFNSFSSLHEEIGSAHFEETPFMSSVNGCARSAVMLASSLSVRCFSCFNFAASMWSLVSNASDSSSTLASSTVCSVRVESSPCDDEQVDWKLVRSGNSIVAPLARGESVATLRLEALPIHFASGPRELRAPALAAGASALCFLSPFPLTALTLPLTMTWRERSDGDKNPARPVLDKSSYVNKLLPMRRMRLPATPCCCFGEQCISRDRITGSSDAVNAHSATAAATSENGTSVTKVWPCFTTAFWRLPSQQSIST
mmetsp:Transcript_12215/g.35879  ORF Transcript_12215/g.35879 Transcript_12215/m.35879 type:complete len:279 (+) Transcript_12215:1436-2272(+)